MSYLLLTVFVMINTDAPAGPSTSVSITLAEVEPQPHPLVSVPDASNAQCIIDFQQFLSDDPLIVRAISSVISPSAALAALEASLSENQLQGFRFVYSEGGRLDNNINYQCWSKLQNLCELPDKSGLPRTEPSVTEGDDSCSLRDTSFSLSSSFMADISDIMEIIGTDIMSSNEPVNDKPVTISQKSAASGTDGTDQSSDIEPSVAEKLVEASDTGLDQQPGINESEKSDLPQQQFASSVVQFPFSNSSYPGDPDSDVLPYPAPAARYSKSSCKTKKPHFFLITSKEAVKQKEKEKQEKLTKENQKLEKQRIKFQKQKDQEILKNKKSSTRASKCKTNREETMSVQKNSRKLTSLNMAVQGKKTKHIKRNAMKPTENGSIGQSDGKKSPSGSHSQCYKICRKKTVRNKKNVLGVIQQTSDYCFLCGEPGTDPPSEEWIQCGECSSWFHEKCANIEDGVFVCENCG